jgi:hypothetical protein
MCAPVTVALLLTFLRMSVRPRPAGPNSPPRISISGSRAPSLLGSAVPQVFALRHFVHLHPCAPVLAGIVRASALAPIGVSLLAMKNASTFYKGLIRECEIRADLNLIDPDKAPVK